MSGNFEKGQASWMIVGLVVVAAFAAGALIGGGLVDLDNGSVGPSNGEDNTDNGSVGPSNGEDNTDNGDSTDSLSQNEVSQELQSFFDNQYEKQEQQLKMQAMQMENVSENDLYLEASIDNVSSSEFGSLYKAKVTTTGVVPAQSQTGQPTGGTEEIDEEQVFYVSQDVRYLFTQPNDLEQGENMGIGENVSEEEIKQSAQSFMDMQLSQTRWQLRMMVMQDNSLSENDVYIDANPGEVSSSELGSLYKVKVAITGTMPSQMGGLENIDEEQDLYVSRDGRYVFQQPIDLEQISQQPQQ